MALLKTLYYSVKPRENAFMLNDDGEVIDTVKIKEGNNTFEYKEGLYNVKRNKVKPLVSKGLMFSRHFYFYNKGIPEPLTFSKPDQGWMPVLEPKTYAVLMEAEIIKKLNTPPNPFGKIKPIYVLIFFIVIGLIYAAVQYGYIGAPVGG